jgi:UDP-N-acetylglucosamine--N-acetylmuramyl-(pentapeptide) pyrophosphoryl-undecaprenol N-acetylglucosamine transferase
MRILFTCGGTGGHINPAVAVAKLFKSRRPETSILFVGAENGMETKLVPAEGFALQTLDIHSFKRSVSPKSVFRNLETIWKMAGCLNSARRLLNEFKPDVVFGTGGYASFPIVYAAAGMGIPTAIHESNAVPGLATRILSRRADCIMVSFEESRRYYKRPDAVQVTGTPVREDFVFTKKEDAKNELGIDSRPVVVSYWGSLGAREMNKIIAEFMRLEADRPDFYHIHAAGSYGFRWLPGMVAGMGVDLQKSGHIELREYIYDMPRVMAAADLVLCRAGASTISELAAAAKPAVIIPSPNVAGNHQQKNADFLGDRGAAAVLSERDCSGKKLYDLVCGLLADPQKLASMSENMREIAVLDSSERIYGILTGLAQKKK